MNVLYRNKMASSKQDSYLLVAAIDFGTTYSGYAFSTRHDFQRDPTNTFLKQWVDPTSSMMNNKTSTCILFTKKKEIQQVWFWGWGQILGSYTWQRPYGLVLFPKIQNVSLWCSGKLWKLFLNLPFVSLLTVTLFGF